MLHQKAQLLGVKELIITLAVAGIIAIVGVLIFSNTTNVALDQFANDRKNTNDSVTITVDTTDEDNSTLLVRAGYITNTEVVRNATNGYLLRRNIDYVIRLTGSSGDLNNRANFTLLNITNETGYGYTTNGFNGSALDIHYDYNAKSAARLSAEKVSDTTLDSFELGVVALIVLAAVVILATVYMLGR